MTIHFVGIGGIGVSALARHFLLEKNKVTGSDLSKSKITEDLEELGADITYRHSSKNIKKETDLVIFSPAIPEDNPEIKKAKSMEIETRSYPKALGELTKDYFTIAVSGTHGKSTTTSMAALVLEAGSLDPTVIVGTKLKEFNDSNYRKGNSEILLIEADEWQGSLLNYHPDIIILTNLELEHVDYYENLEKLLETFQNYVDRLDENGVAIINNEDENLMRLKVKQKVNYFSKEDSIAEKVKEKIKVPGVHNLENALAAYRLGKTLEIESDLILDGLSKYEGSWRRFEQKKIQINQKKYDLVLDYAHHPTELKAVLQAAREKFEERRIWAIFQPHQYQRSMHLKKEFVEVFKSSPVDKLSIVDIYSVPGREKESIKDKISSKALVDEVESSKIEYLPGNLKEISGKIRDNLQGNELIVIIGAGDIYKVEDFLKG